MLKPTKFAAGLGLVLLAVVMAAPPVAAAKKDKVKAEKLGLAGKFLLTIGKSGKCLSKVSGDKLAKHVGAWKCRTKSSNQGFKVKWTDGPWFQLRTARGNLCVEISGSSKKNGKPVVQWSCTGKKNQQWKIVGAGKRVFQLQARHSGKCLTLDGPDEKVSKFSQRTCANKKKNQNQRLRVYR